MYMSLATKKFKWTIKVKLKAKALQHFKFDQVLKIHTTFLVWIYVFLITVIL